MSIVHLPDRTSATGAIRYVATHIVYENPRPHVRSRHGYFPGLVKLRSGDLLALLVISEAFESADATTWVARSLDSGRTWNLERPVNEEPQVGIPTSDYLKPAILDDGSLVAIGYRFHREDPEASIGIAATGGFLDGDDIVAFSHDDGRTWTAPTVIRRSRPELVEISGPCVQLPSGDLVAAGALLKRPDGSNPSGQCGVLLRSSDRGRTWNDGKVFFESAACDMTPLESRLCAMQPGRLVAIAWAYDYKSDRSLTNHIVLSDDDGLSWSRPIDTGHMAQASALLWLGGDRLLSVQAHRGEEVGLYVRLVELRGSQWHVHDELLIYGSGARRSAPDQSMTAMFASLRFGQPSLLRVSDDEILATHWCVEDGLGKIRTHRLAVR